MVPRDPDEAHRAATQLELFFDLVIVIAVANLTTSLHHAIAGGHGAAALPAFAFLFVGTWWAWMNFTWFASAFDTDDAPYRATVAVIMGGALLFAAGIGHIFATLDFSWGLWGWVVMRLGMIALWLRAARASPALRTTALVYAGGILAAQLGWAWLVLAGPAPGGAAFFAAVVAINAVELSVPLAAERFGRTPWHRAHIIERYGLFTIIVLGEVLLSIAAAFAALYERAPDEAHPASGVAAFATVFAVWWLYFTDADRHLATSRDAGSFGWGYGHVLLFAALAVLGAGLAAGFEGAAGAGATYAGGGLAAALLALWAVRDRVITRGLRRAALPAGAVAVAAATLAAPSIGLFAALAVLTLAARVLIPEAAAAVAAS